MVILSLLFGRCLLSGHFLDLDIADIIGSDICDHRPPLRLAIRLIQTADLLSLFEFNLFSILTLVLPIVELIILRLFRLIDIHYALAAGSVHFG